jgi:magnesium chelatase subunit H
MFTTTNPESRRVLVDAEGRVKVKVVYVVLEAQYQSALSQTVKKINSTNKQVRA